MFKNCLFILISLMLFPYWHVSSTSAQNQYPATFSHIKSRPLAMGGAFTSIDDDLEAAFYNPATFSLYQNEKEFRITCFINPVAPFLYYKNQSSCYQQKLSEKELANAVALICKGIVISTRYLDAGIILAEETFMNVYHDPKPGWFDARDIWNNSANVLVMNFRLAKRVSIGVSSTMYYHRINNVLTNGVGFSYGILLRPASKLNVGLAFMDFPDNLTDYRLLLERMIDETMNIGVSYRPTSSTIFSLDIRNLTEENKENVRELHFGFEQTLFSIIALRWGLFKERFTSNYNYAVGIGLFSSNLIHKSKDTFNHNDFIINYSFIYQEEVNKFSRWHLLSIVFRI